MFLFFFLFSIPLKVMCLFFLNLASFDFLFIFDFQQFDYGVLRSVCVCVCVRIHVYLFCSWIFSWTSFTSTGKLLSILCPIPCLLFILVFNYTWISPFHCVAPSLTLYSVLSILFILSALIWWFYSVFFSFFWLRWAACTF